MGAPLTGGINWAQYLPSLIGAGASAAGQIYGASKQAGAIDKSTQLQAQTAQQQLNATLAMYGLNRGDRAPLRAVGVNALNTLQNWKPGQQNALAPVNFSQYRPNQVDLPPQLQSLSSGNALSPGGGGAYGSPGFGDISTKGIQSRLGGIGKGAVGGAGLGATIGSFVPGVGTAIGALGGAEIGAIKGIFANQNPDRNFATEGINRVSDWTWNQLMPSVKSGQISPQEAEQALNQTFARWEASMRNTPNFNSDVLQKSIASQRAYLQPAFDELNRLKGGQQGVA